ncbi:MAG TPA: oxidoreductase [Nevskiaceae bacterium]|nr:oxidoreductase [Nevskiaceae bacterium]
MKKQWTAADMPPQDDKLALVTGANRGLGLEISVGLARAGARVVMACRDAQRAQDARAEVQRRVPNAQVELMSLDLADLASVRAFAQAYAAKFPRIDILCNNASAIMVPLSKTRDGIEMHMGVNHFGHFALTGLLLEQLKAAPRARIVNTASLAHRMTPGLDLDDLGWERKPYNVMHAYGQSKLASLVYTFELGRRLRKSGSTIVAAAAHPGYTATNPDLGGFFMRLSTRLFAQAPAMGALPALYAATMPDVTDGDYLGPGGMKELGGAPKKVRAREEAYDGALGARLWALSEQLTGVRYLD